MNKFIHDCWKASKFYSILQIWYLIYLPLILSMSNPRNSTDTTMEILFLAASAWTLYNMLEEVKVYEKKRNQF